MARFLVNDECYRCLVYENDSPSPGAEFHSPGGYRFGRVRGKSARGSLHRVQGTFRRVIEAIVDSKLRRMARELELRGIPTRDPR
jgi:hypothetical protein